MKRSHAALAITFVLVAGSAGVLLFSLAGDDEPLEHLKASLLESRSWEYPRPEPAPGWKIISGDAASDYRRAVNQCQLASFQSQLNEATEDLNIAGLTHAPPATDQPDCQKAGIVTVWAGKARVDQLSLGVCQKLLRCRAALGHLESGSRRAIMKSPYFLWDVSPQDRQGFGNYRGYLALASLNLLAARGQDHLRGDTEYASLLQAIWTNLRFAQDLSRGDGLVSAMVSVAIANRAHVVLGQILSRVPLTKEALRQIAAELAYLDGTAPTFAQTMQTEYLVIMSGFFSVEALPNRPAASLDIGQNLPWFDRLLFNHAIPDIHAQWTHELEGSLLPYPQRQAHRQKGGQPKPGINPIAHIASVYYGNYDEEFTARAAMRRLLYKAAVYRLKERSAPAFQGSPHMMKDPLTGDDFGQEETARETRLYSRVSRKDDPVELHLQPHPKFLWPAPAGEPSAPSP